MLQLLLLVFECIYKLLRIIVEGVFASRPVIVAIVDDFDYLLRNVNFRIACKNGIDC